MDPSAHSGTQSGDVTQRLRRWVEDDFPAVDELPPMLYQGLRSSTAIYFGRERSHFLAVGAQAMRRILVEHARRHAAARRPSPALAMPIATVLSVSRAAVTRDRRVDRLLLGRVLQTGSRSS
jgi:hypothetical protein